jgi:hypothetical protein
MSIDYGYLYNRSMDTTAPNKAFRDAFIRNPGEVTRLANQDEGSFFSTYGTLPQSTQEASTAPGATPLATPSFQQPVGGSSGLGGDSGGIGDNSFSNPIGGNSFSNPIGGISAPFGGILGNNPGMAQITGMAGGVAGVPGSGLLGNVLFGDNKSIGQSAVGTGLGYAASKANIPGLSNIIGPAMKLADGKPLNLEDAVRFAAGFHPISRGLMTIFDLVKMAYGAYEKSQRKNSNEFMDNEVNQWAFDQNPSPDFPQDGLASIYNDTPVNTATTENTYDSPYSGGVASGNDSMQYGGGNDASLVGSNDFGGWDNAGQGVPG